MSRRTSRSRFLVPPGGGETVRAFAIFAGLLVVLLWAAHAVAFQDMSRLAYQSRRQLGTQEAQRIAEAVTSLGRGPAGMDFSRIQRNLKLLESFMQDRLANRPDLRWVELRDRFGAPVANVRSPNASAAEATIPAHALLVLGGVPQGEVRVGVSAEAIDRDIETLRRSLRIKVALIAAIGVGLLLVGLAFVLHLIRKNYRLEQAKLSSERAAYRGHVGSGLAHEIRNPLNSMNMNLQMLEEELQGVPALEGGEHVEMLRSMQGEIKRIKNLIDNFLQYSRPAVPNFEVKDLNDVLTATARFVQADFRQNGIELSLDLEPLLPSVELDEGQLRQALLNILGNARHVVPSGGNVRLSSRAGAGGEVVVEVEDTGPGIPPETAERIFEPFFSKRPGGTGLGLAIARQMVENHHGRIEVESQVGRGTTFRIRLPRRHARSAETAAASKTKR
jgi:signal transduction histidine kinase